LEYSPFEVVAVHDPSAWSPGKKWGEVPGKIPGFFMGQDTKPLKSGLYTLLDSLRIYYLVGMGSGNKLVRGNPLGSSPDLAKFNNEVYQGQRSACEWGLL